ncbi:MAG: hypothetical protein F6K40_08635 [Okeania sp. SIO3I5]|uniref:hypothetical protein n=1 Tax=Okeania sp. SIO3I5 TaxID=2607805 RepID=UPI0013B79C91|nr:hypothetical protein [Okeania sp. SIO3I5]NEQ36342.1 hypothetical protein [Okeania sp. SIO3I5]
MNNQLPPIYFYLPRQDWPNQFPDSLEEYRPPSVFGTWIIQTYLRLKEIQFPCQLVDTMPDEGIVVVYRYSLPIDIKPPDNLLWVGIKGDQNPHPYVQVHLVQNMAELAAPAIQIQDLGEDRYLLPGKRFYMPHWPQPGVIPRNPNRGDRFENVAYFGISYNLAPELQEAVWEEELQKLGLVWQTKKRNFWHDYSEVDAIVAVRSFDGKTDYPWKPASKLFNAWNANVPAILGVESAFQGERKSELDYFEVKSASEAIAVLKRLKDDRELRRAIVENCQVRAEEIKPENIAKRWSDFLTKVCVPEYYKWRSASAWERQRFFLSRQAALKIVNIQKKLLTAI